MKKALMVTVLLLGVGIVQVSGQDFKWLPVTSEDLASQPDSTWGEVHAFYVFTRTEVNDRRGYIDIYNRMKILDNRGIEENGNVTLVYPETRGILAIEARTISPSGQVYPVRDINQFRKEITNAKGYKKIQYAFSYPHMEPGCLVDFHYRVRSKAEKDPRFVWVWPYAEEVPVREATLHWVMLPRKRRRVEMILDGRLRKVECEPFFQWIPDSLKGAVQRDFHHNRYDFVIRNVTPFEEEPYAPPSEVIRPRLELGYTVPTDAYGMGGFWSYYARSVIRKQMDFGYERRRLKRLIEMRFSAIDDPLEKAKAIYDWFRENVKHWSYWDQHRFFANSSVDDVIYRHYGSFRDIALSLLWAFREAGLHAYNAFTVDRDDGVFDPRKEWDQFQRRLVVVEPHGTQRYFCFPGVPVLGFGELPWYCEGVRALVVEDRVWKVVNVPWSKPATNRLFRSIVLRVDSSLKVSGTIVERRSGHYALALRFKWVRAKDEELPRLAAEKLESEIRGGSVDIDSLARIRDVGAPMYLRGKLIFDAPLERLGRHVHMRPLSYFVQSKNPFTSETRKYPIVFRFPYELIETTTVEIPRSLRLDMVPPDTLVANKVGLCQIRFMAHGDTSVAIQRAFKINKPFWDREDYGAVRALFAANEATSRMPLVLVVRNSTVDSTHVRPDRRFQKTE